MERTPSLLQLGRSTSHVLQQQEPLILRLPESFSWSFRNQPYAVPPSPYARRFRGHAGSQNRK